MGAAVEDVGHREGEQRCVIAAQMPVERNTLRLRCRLRHGQRNAEDGVGPEPGFVRGTVELDQGLVEAFLVVDVEVAHAPGDLTLDVAHRPQDALASVALRVAVAQLNRLVDPGRCARRHDGATAALVGESGHCNRRVAARIEHLEGAEARQSSHEVEV